MLVIVDAQEEFVKEAFDPDFSNRRQNDPEQATFLKRDRYRFIRHLNGLIREAVATETPICVLRYNHCGPMVSSTAKALRGYPKAKTYTKNFDDGSGKVLAFLREQSSMPEQITLVGGNISYCLYATALGVATDGPGVAVIVDLSASFCYQSPKYIEQDRLPYYKANRIKLVDPVKRWDDLSW